MAEPEQAIPEAVMSEARKIVDAAEDECRAAKCLVVFPTVRGKETLDKHIARAIIAAELRGREAQKEANPLPAEIQSMIDGGWKFAWEPETWFIGATHPRGGSMSVLQIEYPRFHCLGEFIATSIRNS